MRSHIHFEQFFFVFTRRQNIVIVFELRELVLKRNTVVGVAIHRTGYMIHSMKKNASKIRHKLSSCFIIIITL